MKATNWLTRGGANPCSTDSLTLLGAKSVLGPSPQQAKRGDSRMVFIHKSSEAPGNQGYARERRPQLQGVCHHKRILLHRTGICVLDVSGELQPVLVLLPSTVELNFVRDFHPFTASRNKLLLPLIEQGHRNKFSMLTIQVDDPSSQDSRMPHGIDIYCSPRFLLIDCLWSQTDSDFGLDLRRELLGEYPHRFRHQVDVANRREKKKGRDAFHRVATDPNQDFQDSTGRHSAQSNATNRQWQTRIVEAR